MKFLSKVSAIGEKAVWAAGACVLFFLTVANFLLSAHVDYETERVRIGWNSPFFLLAALVICALLFLSACLSDHINERMLFITLTLGTLLAGGLLIYNAGGELRSDPLYCYETAMELAQGDYRSFLKDGYLHYYPHQLGIVIYDRLLLLISGSAKLIFFCNLLEVAGINFFLWRLTDLFGNANHAANVNVLFLSFGFLPQFFFILFAYGLIPGFFCLMAAFYFGGCLVCRRQKRYFILTLLFACLAVFLKKNNLIGILALAAWLCLKSFQSGKVRQFAAAALLLPCSLLFVGAVKNVCEWKSGIEIGDGVPPLLHIGMGVNPNNEMLGPGWFDGSNWSYFTQCGQDSEAAGEMARNLMKIYWEQTRDNPVHAIKFYAKKNFSIWCEPMFQSVFSGPVEFYGQSVDTDFLQALYRGDWPEPLFYGYMKGYMILLLGAGLFFCLKKRGSGRGMELLLIYHIGGFLFHLFWEAKSQYTYPYVFALLPMCAVTAADLAGRLRGSLKQYSNAGKEYYER